MAVKIVGSWPPFSMKNAASIVLYALGVIKMHYSKTFPTVTIRNYQFRLWNPFTWLFFVVMIPLYLICRFCWSIADYVRDGKQLIQEGVTIEVEHDEED